MRKISASILTLLMLCVSPAVWSAGQMKPGLWEMTMKSDAMKSMPKIPPEQIEKMKQMGVNMPQMQDGAIVTKVCISKEMAEREQPPQMTPNESGCQAKNYQRKADSYSVDIVCDSAQMKGTGSAKGAFASNESFNSTYDFKGTAHGQSISQHYESSGKWLNAACGDIKPVDQLMQHK
jgi:hypothetical protein